MVAHLPVLLQEVVDGLEAKRGDIVLDATVGGGGHSEALCKSVGGGATFVCLDADADAIERSRARLAGAPCAFHFYRTNFRRLEHALAAFGIAGVNRVLFDLGLSSFQLEESGRGFSFMRDEPLLMTFEKNTPPADLPAEASAQAGDDSAPLVRGDTPASRITAETIVNEWSEETLATLLEGYGEERHAKRIARKIVEAREHSRISTTFQLTAIVESAVRRKGKIHPATKTFQALRVAVNDEFQALKEGLFKAWRALAKGGRVAVISFHSIEDRTVKGFFRELGKKGEGKVITKKPVTPTRAETRANPRARSAKLRIVEKR